jgi:hypothetical protein
MRRFVIFASFVAAVLVGTIAGAPGLGTVAQEGTPAAMAGHPVVGAW